MEMPGKVWWEYELSRSLIQCAKGLSVGKLLMLDWTNLHPKQDHRFFLLIPYKIKQWRENKTSAMHGNAWKIMVKNELSRSLIQCAKGLSVWELSISKVQTHQNSKWFHSNLYASKHKATLENFELCYSRQVQMKP